MAQWNDEYGDIIRSAMADLGMQPPERDPNVPPEVIYGDRLKHYPDASDVANARANDFDYGSGNEAFNSGRVARVLHVPSKLSSTFEDLTNPANAMTSKGTPALAHDYAAAQLAINRSPIAALGYDPRNTNMDTDSDPTLVLNGVYTPASNSAYANADNPPTLVHESIHRGMERLRRDNVLSPELTARLPPEESLVRYIMALNMGDPDKNIPTNPAGRNSYRDIGLQTFGRNINDPQQYSPYSTITEANRRAALVELNNLAAQHLLRLRPGGPR